MKRLDAVLHRCLDVAAAIVVGTLAAPVLILASVAVRMTLGAPVLFRQQRLGLGGRPFWLLKLRTMRSAPPGVTGPELDAARTTRLGQWLRRTSVDELPSLLNLLRGDITLVGPRPLPVAYLARYTARQARRMEVRPGLTGLAQVSGRNLVDWPERLELDVRYVEQRSWRLDVSILWRTIGVLVGGRGVNAGAGVTMTELPPQTDSHGMGAVG